MIVLLQCQYCHKEFETNKKTRKYCSPICSSNSKKTFWGEATCQHCNTIFSVKANTKNKYCKIDCYLLAMSEQKKKTLEKKKNKTVKEKEPKICNLCSTLFVPVNSNTKYCGSICKEKAIKNCIQKAGEKKRKERMALFVPKTFECKECGESFTTTYENQRKTFCSNECSGKHGRRNAKHRRRARMKEQYVESVSLLKICKRDNYVCQLCNQSVDMTQLGTSHYLAPSLDHIIPLSKGGEHSYANSQLAHHYCNSIKKDKIL